MTRAKLPDFVADAAPASWGRAARATRREWLTAALGGVALAVPGSVGAQEARVPARLQAELLAKVAAYDGKFAARAGHRATLLVVVAPDVSDSERLGAQIRAERSKQARIGGAEHMEEIVRYSSPSELARLCRERRAALVYLSTGLSAAAESIADALTGMDVLSVFRGGGRRQPADHRMTALQRASRLCGLLASLLLARGAGAEGTDLAGGNSTLGRRSTFHSERPHPL